MNAIPWDGPRGSGRCRRTLIQPLVRALPVAAGVLLAGCATAADLNSERLLPHAIAIEREAITCNQSVASKARYQDIAGLLPLTAPYQASVAQMANTDRANNNEARALAAWTEDIQKCRRAVAEYVRRSAPVALALVLSAWADEDMVFVGVLHRKLSWGGAATRLRSIHVRLLSNITDRAIQIDAQISSARQAELSRRVAVFNAITNLAP